MRMPIKISRGILPVCCSRIVPTKTNPRGIVFVNGPASRASSAYDRYSFSQLVSAFTSGPTWKSTRPGRHQLTDGLILELCAASRPVILDIGVSDGVTSLELIERLASRFRKYFVADVSFKVSFIERRGNIYFYNSQRTCFLIAAKTFIVYSDQNEAWFPFNRIARYLLSHAPEYADDLAREARLLQPELLTLAEKDPRIAFREYSIFDEWLDTSPDLVKVANLLNRDYFSDHEIRNALRNIKEALRSGGKLFVTDNRETERVSMFSKLESTFVLEHEINGGTEVADIALGA